MSESPAAAPVDETPTHAPFEGWGFRRRPSATGMMTETGSTGLVHYGEEVSEEWHHALRGRRAVRVFREMGDNDSSVGASLHLMDSHVRQVGWFPEAADHPMGEEAAEFLAECMGDMSDTWVDFASEAFTFVQFGWSWFEKVYKYREGPDAPPEGRSKFTDGKVGLRKVAIRAQETLDGWQFDDAGGLQGMWQRAAPRYERVLIPIEKSVLFRPKQSKNNPEGKPLLRPAYRPWFFLKRLEELEAVGIERDLVGLGKMELPLPYFDANAPPAKRAAKERWAQQLSQIRRNEHEGIVVPAELNSEGKPTGYKFSLVTTGGTRALDIGAAITRHRQSIGQVLLTQFMFLGMDKVGTQALSMSLTSLFTTSLSVLLDAIQETWDRFVVHELMELNGYPREAWPKWKHGDVEKTDMRPLAESILALVNAGVLTPDATLEEYIRNEARLPPVEEKPEGEDDDDDPKGLPKGSEETNRDAAGAVVALTTAIANLAKIGDVEMVNAARYALAALLGIENPAPLSQEQVDAMKPQSIDGVDGSGDAPPGKKPPRKPSAKPPT